VTAPGKEVSVESWPSTGLAPIQPVIIPTEGGIHDHPESAVIGNQIGKTRALRLDEVGGFARWRNPNWRAPFPTLVKAKTHE